MSSKREVKKGIDSEESRRRREASTLAVRKDKKEESLAKRRNMSVSIDQLRETSMEPSSAATQVASNAPTLGSNIGAPEANKRVYKVADIPELMIGLQSFDREVQFTSIRGFRKLLSVESNAPVQECIDCGAIPLFVQYLQRSDYPEAQFEAAWALTNVASTDRTSVVVEFGAIPHLVQLLTVASHEIREQAAWCLGNVAGDCANYRDLILHYGALNYVVMNIMKPHNVSLLRNCTWTLSNFCRGKPQPKLSQISQALPAIQAILVNNIDQEASIDATWALSYICDGDNDRIQVVVNLGIVPVLVSMLNSGKVNLIVPALRTLGNIVSGDDSQTQAVVNAGVLTALIPLLSHSKRNIRKESLWMLSNIAAGTPQQLAALMATPKLLPIIIEQLGAGVEWDIRKEATWVVCNIASSSDPVHIMSIVEHGAIRQLCGLLDISDVKLLMISLEALEIILRIGESSNKSQDFNTLVDEAEGIEKIENLQNHENELIYKKAVFLIETYFGCEEECESENLKPATSNNTFSFGFPTNENAVGKQLFSFNQTSSSSIQPQFTF